MSVVLKEDCHRTSKISQFQRLDILTINEYAPLCGVVDSSNKLEDCAFAGSIRTDYDLAQDADRVLDQPHAERIYSIGGTYAKLAR